MFSKPNNPQPAPPAPGPRPDQPIEPSAQAPRRASGQKLASLIANDMTLEGSITSGGELQIDGAIKGDVRVEQVTVGETGQVEGGIFAEAVEVRGRVSGAITAKQVRLYGACHVDGDITHEQLAMETGAFFQGRSLRLQRAAGPAASPHPAPTRSPEPAAPAPPPPSTPPGTSASATKEAGNGLGAKPSATP
ncbi:MAG: bactofilin family protein [Caulobacteraceae bacterium]